MVAKIWQGLLVLRKAPVCQLSDRSNSNVTGGRRVDDSARMRTQALTTYLGHFDRLPNAQRTCYCVLLCEGRGSLADREEQQVTVWEGETWSVATKLYVVSRSAQKKNMWVRHCGP